MPIETATFTALPNGFVDTPDGPRLRVCVFVSPKLTLEPGDDDVLGSFRTFRAWPDALATITFAIVFDSGNGVVGEPDPAFPAADQSTWDAVFHHDLAVETRQPSDLHERVIRSFPVAPIVEHVEEIYRLTAASSATEFPPLADVAALVAPAAHPERQEIDGRLPEGEWGPDGRARLKKGQQRLIAAPAASSATASAYAQALRFYTRPGEQEPRNATTPRPEPAAPTLDFHKVCAMVGDYPMLLRALGLAVDLLFAPEVVANETGRIRVARRSMTGDLAWGAADGMRPWTRYEHHRRGRLFIPRPRDGSDLRDGMLDLAGRKDTFVVTALDVDGSANKILQLAGSVESLQQQAATHDPKGASLPALRSAGIVVARTRRDEQTVARTDATDGHEQAAGADTPADLWADDVTRGYRVDVDREDARGWKSLTARRGRYAMHWPGEPTQPLDVPEDDEGYAKAGSASAVPPEIGGAPDLYVHEAMFGWDGWSLVAGRPGAHVGMLEAEPDKVELDDACPLLTAFEPAAGSLPSLRYGKVYRVRARAVDLAGNSLTLDEGSETIASRGVRFERYDPVPPPVVIPRAGFTEGESSLRMVIRSTRNETPTSYVALARVKALPRHQLAGEPVSFGYEASNERHIAPPRGSQQMAERHGRFDLAMGVLPDDSVYDTFYALAIREARVLADPGEAGFQVVVPDGAFGAPLPAPISPAQLDAAFAKGAYWLREDPQLRVPYLPDVFATGVSFVGLPGAAFLEQSFDAAWPDPLPFRIRIVDGPANTAPTFVDDPGNPGDSRVLVVTLPQATMARVRVASVLTEEHLDQMAIWQLLSKATKSSLHDLARAGRHWMLTPGEELVLVHAVEKPLTDPKLVLDGGAATRQAEDTFAVLQGHVDNHAASTGRLDIDANWADPIDDVAADAPSELRGGGHAGDFTIEDHEWAARTGRDEAPVDPGPRLHRLRHEFGDTKHRWVFYDVKATTRFREYFPPEITSNETLITATTTATQTVNVPSSRRPEAPDVRYVVPTFEWRDDPRRHRRTRVGRGLRIYLGRPWYSSGADEHLAVVLRDQRPPWKTVLTPALEADVVALAKAGIDVDALAAAAPRLARGGVDVGKLVHTISAAMTKPAKDDEIRASLAAFEGIFGFAVLGDVDKYVTHWGKDPVWESGAPGRGPRIETFTNYDRYDTGVALAELPIQTAAVAAWVPQYDDTRRLWYVDVELDPGPAYTPFIQMALARYQPYSIDGLELSKVVHAEFAQVLPDRTATVTPYGEVVRVGVEGVAGFNYFSEFVGLADTRHRVDASRLVLARIERRRSTSVSDLEWEAATDTVTLGHAGVDKNWVSRWDGRVVVPELDDAFEYRLAVEEYELQETDPSQAEFVLQSRRLLGYDWGRGVLAEGWETPVAKRLFYADHFALRVVRGRLVL